MGRRTKRRSRQERAKHFLRDPDNPQMFFYSPTGNFKALNAPITRRMSRRLTLDEWADKTYGKVKRVSASGRVLKDDEPDPIMPDFSQVEDIDPLIDIGWSRPKVKATTLTEGLYHHMEFDAGFIPAPQYYKDEASYRKFTGKPRQMQMYLVGNPVMPVPMGARTFRGREAKDVHELRKCAYVRGFHVNQKELKQTVTEQYWPKRKKLNKHEVTWGRLISRMVSRFAGGHANDEADLWIPQDVYDDPNFKMYDEEDNAARSAEPMHPPPEGHEAIAEGANAQANQEAEIPAGQDPVEETKN